MEAANGKVLTGGEALAMSACLIRLPKSHRPADACMPLPAAATRWRRQMGRCWQEGRLKPWACLWPMGASPASMWRSSAAMTT
eukprot:1145896-Pelagomonas_calceolata.AAC.1